VCRSGLCGAWRPTDPRRGGPPDLKARECSLRGVGYFGRFAFVGGERLFLPVVLSEVETSVPGSEPTGRALYTFPPERTRRIFRAAAGGLGRLTGRAWRARD
jgi:hypothetical protein